MEEKGKSVLTLDLVMFEDVQYSRKLTESPSLPEYEMNFVRTVNENPDKVHAKVSLTANIRSKDDSISLKITIAGFFSCDYSNEETRKILIYENAVAILFPYLRSQITLVSTQPGLPSIIIPPVNIVDLFNSAETDNK